MEEYSKQELRDHIYNNTDTYLGGSDEILETLGIYEDEKIVIKEIQFIPAIYNAINEIFVNARDQFERMKDQENKVTKIKVNYNKDTGRFSVLNDGEGILIKIHSKEGIYNPELIFGHLLTSGNYKEKGKTVGGKNGYGAKLVNIFSNVFEVETADSRTNLLYKQTFSNNMKVISKPVIKKYKGKPYTRITWDFDYKRFNIEKLSVDMEKLIERRINDIAGITDNKLTVYYNDKKINIKCFSDYIKLYDGDKYYEKLSERWEIAVGVSNTDKFEQVSFVNGISTPKGGVHVDVIVKLLSDGIVKYINKKYKKEIPNKYIKNHLSIYINSVIEDPSFDSQTKERLITPKSKFGSQPEISDKYIKKICDKGLSDKILKFAEFKENKNIKKTDGVKKNKIRGIPKLDDANWAGTKKSDQCVLILTEGDSAKSMAISGLSIIGRDKYGVYPLKGKILNVKDISNSQIGNNKELIEIKKILGLETGKKYENVKSLRYGKIMVMTDQDHDGSHIKGLLLNIFHTLWPSLLELNYIVGFVTPIVKASYKKQNISFYTMTDYNNWKDSQEHISKWSIKYYKGLGTSTSNEAKDYFRNMKVNNYLVNGELDLCMNLAFKKTQADNRKDWLYNYNPQSVLDYNDKNIPISDFVNKELIHFSNADNMRSIGSVFDGLKPSQRKVLYSCFKRKLTKEIKVAQFSGYVSEHSAYHHGEASLQSTIIAMAQNFVGSNNINLLDPCGQFGTRMMGW